MRILPIENQVFQHLRKMFFNQHLETNGEDLNNFHLIVNFGANYANQSGGKRNRFSKISSKQMKQANGRTVKKEKRNEFLNNLLIKSIDGVVILFFVVSGLTSAGVSTKVLLTTSFLILILIALIMGVSAFLAAKEERNHFYSLQNRDLQQAEDLKERKLLQNLGIGLEVQFLAQEEIDKDRKNWKNLMMQLDEGQNMTGLINPLRNGVTTWLSYIFGGTIPSATFFFINNTSLALQYASILSLTLLFILGMFKSIHLKSSIITGAMLALFSGALAGIAGFFIAKLFEHAI